MSPTHGFTTSAGESSSSRGNDLSLDDHGRPPTAPSSHLGKYEALRTLVTEYVRGTKQPSFRKGSHGLFRNAGYDG
ncbi:hypothetical protein Dda_7307 [Drechslerella dactyloides]|uniref:Uncharacterized protein n=1 Tax=Drechslerella dactyloides TaxID=74499 RepID=A0AAD6ISC6_DREDA|nr:hypothetical protein Dda_7307 [Drechslerella dactyloides]